MDEQNDSLLIQYDVELTENEQKQVEANDQGIHILLICLPADVYVVVDSCENEHAMWLRIQRVWKSIRYGVSKGLDTAYWSFLEHGYAVSSLMDTAYWSSE
ncbi:hypothetical protein Tco_0778702 [Tanacetum coccineum]